MKCPLWATGILKADRRKSTISRHFDALNQTVRAVKKI
jgi:hypothetical protein